MLDPHPGALHPARRGCIRCTEQARGLIKQIVECHDRTGGVETRQNCLR